MTRSAGASPRVGDSAGPTPGHTITIYRRISKSKCYLPQHRRGAADARHPVEGRRIILPRQLVERNQSQEEVADKNFGRMLIGSVSRHPWRRKYRQNSLCTPGYLVALHYYHHRTFTKNLHQKPSLKNRKSENSIWLDTNRSNTKLSYD